MLIRQHLVVPPTTFKRAAPKKAADVCRDGVKGENALCENEAGALIPTTPNVK